MRGSATGLHDGSGLRTAIEETDDGQVHVARNPRERGGRKARVRPAEDQPWQLIQSDQDLTYEKFSKPNALHIVPVRSGSDRYRLARGAAIG